MKIKSLIFTALFIASTSASAQDGFDADSVRSFLEKRMVHVPQSEPASVDDDYRMLVLGIALNEFRETAVLSARIDVAEQFSDSTSGALKALQEGEFSSQLSFLWPYVIAGSFYVVGNSLSDEPIAALYNPYFDVAILTRWKAVEGAVDKEGEVDLQFQLTEAVPVNGSAFMEKRISRLSDLPVWTDSKAAFEVKFVEAAQNFVRKFEDHYPPFSRNSAPNFQNPEGTRNAVAVVERRVIYCLKWVRDAQDPKAPVNYASEIKQVQGALSSPFSSKLERMLPDINPQRAEAFFRLGSNIRKGMKPYLVVDKTVILIDPVNLPLGFISLHVEQDKKTGPVGLMALFNIEAQYPIN